MEYYNRLCDDLLLRKLRSSGAILIEGPKWCGKTSTGVQHAKSVIYLQDPDKRKSYIEMADTKPSLLLQGDTPHLIDEWQTIPVMWDAVRYAVDQHGKMGQFILTGSTTPLGDDISENEIMHSGTGRIARMRTHSKNEDVHHESLGIPRFIRRYIFEYSI